MSTREVGEEIVILDRRSSQVHQLNSTAAFVWRRLDGAHTVEEIAEALVREFGVEETVANRDARQVVGQMGELGLIEERETVV